MFILYVRTPREITDTYCSIVRAKINSKLDIKLFDYLLKPLDINLLDNLGQ